MADVVSRVVALGASNLTRGFHTVVAAARAAWGPEVEVLGALGHGRSYGVRSRVLVRALPSILDSGLWDALDEMPPASTRALVTDVGNDILYGFEPPRILSWVEEAVVKLRRLAADVVLTGLPLHSIREISTARFLAFRSVLVPACRLSLDVVRQRAEAVDEGLRGIASRHSLRFLALPSQWYGIDPIHFRPSVWRPAWQEILGTSPSDAVRATRREALRLYLMAPERRWLCGLRQHTPQVGVRLPSGGRVRLY